MRLDWFIILTITILITPLSGDFTYQSDDDTYWKSTSPFHIRYNQTYGTIISRTATYITFNLEIHDDHSTYQSQNIFEISTAHSSEDIGSTMCPTKLPSFGIEGNEKFQLSIQDKDTEDNCQQFDNVDINTIQNDAMYKIIIHFNQEWLRYEINQTLAYDNTRTFATLSETLGSDLSISFGHRNKDIPMVNATISGIIIMSYDQTKPFPQSLLESITETSHGEVEELPFTDYQDINNDSELTPSPISTKNDTDEDIPTTSQVPPDITRFVTGIMMDTDDGNLDDTSIVNEKYVIAGAVFLVITICIVLLCYIYANKSEGVDEKEMVNHRFTEDNSDGNGKPVERFGSIESENKDHQVHIVKLKLDRIDSNDATRGTM